MYVAHKQGCLCIFVMKRKTAFFLNGMGWGGLNPFIRRESLVLITYITCLQVCLCASPLDYSFWIRPCPLILRWSPSSPAYPHVEPIKPCLPSGGGHQALPTRGSSLSSPAYPQVEPIKPHPPSCWVHQALPTHGWSLSSPAYPCVEPVKPCLPVGRGWSLSSPPTLRWSLSSPAYPQVEVIKPRLPSCRVHQAPPTHGWSLSSPAYPWVEPVKPRLPMGGACQALPTRGTWVEPVKPRLPSGGAHQAPPTLMPSTSSPAYPWVEPVKPSLPMCGACQALPTRGTWVEPVKPRLPVGGACQAAPPAEAPEPAGRSAARPAAAVDPPTRPVSQRLHSAPRSLPVAEPHGIARSTGRRRSPSCLVRWRSERERLLPTTSDTRSILLWETFVFIIL